MRTTLDIPDDLLRDAMAAFGIKTKTQAVRMGLEELLRRKQVEDLIARGGTIAVDLDTDVSRKRAWKSRR